MKQPFFFKKLNKMMLRFFRFFKRRRNSIILSLIEKIFYIRFYGDNIYISPAFKEHILHRHAADRFKIYRNTLGNQRCFVIGNGPSLNKLDLAKLKNEVTIGSNGIYLNFDRMGFYPTIYTVVNYFIAEQMGNHILEIDNPVKIFPSFLKNYFINSRGETLFLNADSGFKCSEDVTIWISWQSTVTFFNLQIAYSLGCPEVFLIGVDNDYTSSVSGKEGEVIYQSEPDQDHFTVNYFKKGFKWQQADTGNMARCYDIVFETFKKNNRKIFNATSGGKLDLFPRVNYEYLF